jgi:hypothetical protein
MALWKVMAKQLYNYTMVRAQCGAFTSSKLDSRETVEDLLERLQDLAVSLPELEGGAGDAVLLQRFTVFCQKSCRLLCAANDETSVDIMCRKLCCNFLRKSRLGQIWLAGRLTPDVATVYE